MDETHTFIIPLLSLISFLLLFKLLIHRNLRNRAPNPPSLPIIGHLHLIMRGHIHRVLEQLSSKYGPIMGLRFGSRPVLIITSPSAAEECFTRNDIVLANRPLLISGKYFDYGQTTLGSAPYGRLWRDLRRVTTLELFSTNRLRSYMGVRNDESRSLIMSLFQDAGNSDFRRVELRSRIKGLSLNIVMRVIADKRIYGREVDDSEEANKFMGMISDVFEVCGASNLADFFPYLEWIDFQGLQKRLSKLQTENDRFSQVLIDERRSRRRNSATDEARKANTFIDAMLSLQESEPEYYTDDIIKGNMLQLVLAGTDTSSVTIEWAMSLLLNHPNVLERARSEIDELIRHERLVQETDLSDLPYIQFIVNETLRLFPAAPMLLPHEPSEDCTIGGFEVARGTMVLVNAWAIHRDPKVWDDPLSFKPERFEGVGNEGYKLIPFGMGRRQCPGLGLAHRVVGLAVASLIQCFEWERIGEELVGLSEGTGLTMPKLQPLEAMCRPRQCMSSVLMEL